MTLEHARGRVAIALIASFMVFVDGTIVNLALARLGACLDATRPQLEWAVNAYTLTFAAVMLGAGAVTDALGAKRTFLFGLLVFTASSGGCALAESMIEFNVARLAQGLGAALLLPSALVLATAGAPDARERHRLVGWWAAAGGLGMATGPLLGGMLVAVAGWRAVFAINVVVGVPAVAWAARAMPSPARRPRRFDTGGMLAATALIGGLVYTLVEGPGRGWSAGSVVAAAALAGAGLACFVVIERLTRNPVLPVGIYTDRGYVATVAQGALFNFAFYGVLFALSLMLQQVRGLSPLHAGLLFVPLTGLIPLGAVCAAPLARRHGRRTVLGAGQTLLAVSLLAVAWASTGTALWPLLVLLVPAGLSAGLLVPTMTSQSLAGIDPALHGAASAVFNTSRQVGAAVGVATFGPLLGMTRMVLHGFTICLIVSAAAAAASLVLTYAVRPRERTWNAPSDNALDPARSGQEPGDRSAGL